VGFRSLDGSHAIIAILSLFRVAGSMWSELFVLVSSLTKESVSGLGSHITMHIQSSGHNRLNSGAEGVIDKVKSRQLLS